MKPLTEAEFYNLLTAARMLDETWPNLEQELWIREMWVRNAEDNLYYYRGSHEIRFS